MKGIIELFDNASNIVKPSKVFLKGKGNVEMTYRSLLEISGKLIGFYQSKGLSIRDKVLVISKDDFHVTTLLLSLLRNGITFINIDPETKKGRLLALIERVKPAAAFIDKDLTDAIPELASIPLLISIDESYTAKKTLRIARKKKETAVNESSFPGLLENQLTAEGPASIPDDTLAYILFTSGTTKDPKGVCITHRNIFSHLSTLSRHFKLDSDSRILNVLMLSHADGLVQGPLLTIYNSASFFRPMRFSIHELELLLNLVYKFRITHFISVPTILSLLNSLGKEYTDTFQTNDFQYVVSAGAQLEQSVWETFENKFKVLVINVYGLTESVTGGIFTSLESDPSRYGSIGNPIDCEVKIIDEDGNSLGLQEEGELCMKGDHVMAGYYADKVSTSEAIRDGWLHTGDMAIRNNDNTYKITGRIKSIIISGGYNIHPEEVTEVLNQHPAVDAAITLGVKDAQWSERVISAVQLNAEAKANSKELIEFCRSNLEPLKVPKQIHILESLPFGRSGKVSLPELRNMLEAESKAKETNSHTDPKKQLLAIASSCFNIASENLSLHSVPDDTPGWDSLAHLELIALVEESFNITITASEIMSIERLGQLHSIISNRSQ